MSFYVYKITNLVNGKIYIGKAKNIESRWKQHKKDAKSKKKCSYFYRAINKYGVENFSVKELKKYETEKEVFEGEIYYILFYNSMNPNIGYNLTKGGEGPSGFKHSKETCKKMSETKQKYITDHKNEFDKQNLKQCKLTKEQCLEIQQKYINMVRPETLSKEYNAHCLTIYNILKGKYLAIRDCSLISKEDFIELRKKHGLVKRIYYSTIEKSEQEKIIKMYNEKPILKNVAKTFNLHESTIRKILKDNNIEIKRTHIKKDGTLINAILKKEDVLKIREKYSSGSSYNQLASEYNVSVSCITHIVKRRCWKHI